MMLASGGLKLALRPLPVPPPLIRLPSPVETDQGGGVDGTVPDPGWQESCLRWVPGVWCCPAARHSQPGGCQAVTWKSTRNSLPQL